MTLRIAHITDERYPSLHTDCQQVIKTADALGREGCHVELIMPRMLRHLPLGPEKRRNRILSHFNVPGHFRVRDILTWPASDLRLEKLPHGVVAPFLTLLGSYDVVHTRNLIPLSIGAVLGMPLLFETYRALPRTEPRVWSLVAKTMKSPNFLGIITHSQYAKNSMVEAGADGEAIAAIPNGFDPDDFENAPTKDEAKRALQLDDKPLAVYTGHIRPDKGTPTLLDLAEDCPECHFLLVGGFPDEVAAFEEAIKERHLSNMTVVEQVPIASVPSYMAAADVLLLPTSAKPLAKPGRSTVLPMKLFSYLAAGRPILGPDLPDTEGILIHEHNGLRVPPDDRSATARGLKRLLEDRGLRKRLGAQAAKDAASYTWQSRAKKIVEFVRQRQKQLGAR